MFEIVMLSAALLAQPAIVEPVQEKPVELEMLAIDLRALSRIVETSDDLRDHGRLMRRIIDDRIEELRQKRSDGTYRWASLEREEADRLTREKDVERVYTEDEVDVVTLEGRDGYRVEIEIPRKKSLFSGNERVFVKRIAVRADGGTEEIPSSVWIEPGSSWAAPLPRILRSGEVVVELGVESGREDAVAEVSVLQAKLVDDPRSPYYPAVSKLLDIRGHLEGSVDRSAIERSIDEALATIPGEVDTSLRLENARALERQRMLASGQLTGTIEPGDASPDTVEALRRISRQLDGTLQEQEAARRELDRLIERLSPGPALPSE